MSTTRFARWQKATALAPMAALSAACTVAIAGAGGPVGTLTAADEGGATPGAVEVPEAAVEAPASVSLPEAVSAAQTDSSIVSASSTSGIPAVALGAYQRAQTIINGADSSCRISWQLVAAIGRVESDHGRYGGTQLDEKGVATPGIFGIPLDGSNGTARIMDTDAAELDNDATYDRAVGPMQFIPSTWRVVGVDADRDGVRDPQNIHDAALATAVYLCSGDEDLSTEAGKRSAVHRYNHSDEYVNLVLAIEEAYLEGEYTSVPNAVAASNYFVPDPVTTRPNDGGSTDTAVPGRPGAPAAGGTGGTGAGATPGTGGGTGSGSTPGTGGGSTPGTGGGSTPGTGGGSGGGTGGGSTPVTPPPAPEPEPPAPTVPPVAEIPGTIVEQVLYTADVARRECLADLNLLGIVAGLLTPNQKNLLNRCINALVGTPVP
ncbi:lytic murein transglycosylase [Nocardioides sp. ChNu-99]|uniref:lytic transglycosylase domain-containing protein n=1 Tax=Nocardioides sp. ChNu-99 TaxID=2839897 RepID=UPI0024068600|nr:lytic murein transglycosylase [Nocardioides sp. ChNu-99]MDF9716733.1 lytic transglycosylase domain-containing protein [Nocardioides sp. ChNu-99]